MNYYEPEFFARCPVNQARIKYCLCIATDKVIPAEEINEYLEQIRVGLHEEIADHLYARFGGKQTLIAHHHGVPIRTERP